MAMREFPFEDFELPEAPVGRPPIVLTQDQAITVVSAIRSGMSDCRVHRMYGQRYGFSRRWLGDAKRDGRLDWMSSQDPL